MQEKYAVTAASRGFLYEKPGDPDGFCENELSDELLSGWAIELLEENKDGWLKVRTFYGYSGWIFREKIREISMAELKRRQSVDVFRMIGARSADVLKEPKVQGTILETLYQDSIVELLQPEMHDSWTKVLTASGKQGWVFSSVLKIRKDDDRFLLTQEPESFMKMAAEVKSNSNEQEIREAVIRSAFSYEGTQYRWGGKSPSGIDCSGLAFMSYLEQGILIYRDAHIEEGFPVKEIPREELKKGDLIFFPGHVALSLGGERFIHATGFAGTPRVLVNSLSPEEPDFREDLCEKVTMCGSIF